MKTTAIIPAAGKGIRFGGMKQFRELRGKPILLYALQIFETSSLIQDIHLVVPQKDWNLASELVEKYHLQKVSKIVIGGEDRQASVGNGIKSIDRSDFVIVHDGVRPFVTHEIIERVLVGARQEGACIAALPVKETIKRASEDGFVTNTIDRLELWSVQTPQAFRFNLFKDAWERAETDRYRGTDEASLMERTGVPVLVVPGSPYNIKITTPEDLEIAEAFLGILGRH